MRKTVEMILKKYGSDLVLQRKKGDVTLRCFFHPVKSTTWQSVEHHVSALGYTSRAEYICIVPADSDIVENDILKLGKRYYLAQRVEPYYYRGEIVYWWVLCVEKGGPDTWGMESLN